MPARVEGRLWGIVSIASRRAPLPAGTEARLAGFTELAAIAVANAQARAEVTASRARIVAAADQTRRRIEQDLHDGAQGPLVTLALQLRAAKAAVPPELGELGAELDRAVAVVTGALDDLREIARGIHPAVLAKGGLRFALKTLARRCPIPVDLQRLQQLRSAVTAARLARSVTASSSAASSGSPSRHSTASAPWPGPGASPPARRPA